MADSSSEADDRAEALEDAPDEVRAQEAELVARLKAGDDGAYETLVRENAGRMLAVARRFLPAEDDAQDAVQEAFASAFRAIDRFEGNARLSTWLHRIVVNACLMKLRTRRRHPEQSIDDLLPGFAEDGHLEAPASPWRKDTLDSVERSELRTLLMEKIRELPEGYRNVLLLRDIEELDTAETAEALGMKPGAVKTRLHRARMALRGLLEPHLADGADLGTGASAGAGTSAAEESQA